jgi:leucyl aminopeptidase
VRADLRSSNTDRYGGACVAAAFLRRFVPPTVRWAHIDLAGPAMLDKPHLHFPAGGTGFGAALLTRLVSEHLPPPPRSS